LRYIVKDSWVIFAVRRRDGYPAGAGQECVHILGAGRPAGRPKKDVRPSLRKSLRKEVIQPQVLLRLPCYDLVPVTDLAVDTTVMWRLRALPAPMT
jgi:hypothetical protein